MTATKNHIHTGADCCTQPLAQSEGIEEIKSHEVSPEFAALRAAGFRLLFEERRPIDIQEWTEAASVSSDDLHEVLAMHSGRVEMDDQNRLVGIAGLTTRHTNHELDVNGSQHWTWCALDAVGILGALEASGTIRSTDPQTDSTITIRFEQGRPEEEAAIFVLNGYDGTNLREELCPLINFFNSRSNAERWVEDRHLTGEILAVEEIVEEAAEMWKAATDPITSP